jgi:peptidoglycan hydrolase-like protein with peptidoglycan-binding domain
MNESGEIVLSRVVIPDYVIVHDGPPSDSSANDYYVRYRDYIKNVASSEIYATWPDAALRANILAIMSFTLNRVYTEWYRNKGYDFTITSSTAYDQKWIYGRNIFQSIDEVVDEIFDQYLSRPDVRQPILTQYCDGKRVTCPNWLSQWGSCNLGEQGFGTLEIIRNYYGDDMYINTAEQISGIPASWPGYDLTIGASGQKVMQMQEQLDTIARVYTAIPRVSADGVFGEGTQASVRAFQKIFDLPQTGVVDFSTWYKISQIYVGITRIAEGIPRG